MLLSTGLAVPCQHFWDGSKTSRKVELEPLVSRPWGVYGTQHHSAEGNWFWIHLKFLQRSTGTMRKLRLGFHLLACVTSTFVFSRSSQCRNNFGWQSGIPSQRPVDITMHPAMIYSPSCPYFLIHYLLQSSCLILEYRTHPSIHWCLIFASDLF